MALQKQPISLNFAQGLDTKSDPNQVQIGSFLSLQNSIFDTSGRLTKRNGYSNITTLPTGTNSTTLTTQNNNLVATGSNLWAYGADTGTWYNKGTIQPIQLSTLPLVRNSSSQNNPDGAVAANGLYLLTFSDQTGNYYYQISDSVTGQQILAPKNLTALDTAVTGITNLRTFVVGNYFIVTYLALSGSTPQLKYIAITSANPTQVPTPVVISATVRSTAAGYDGAVTQNTLVIAWAATGSILAAKITSSLVLTSSVTVDGAHSATLMTVSIDNSNPAAPRVYIFYYDSATSVGTGGLYTFAFIVINNGGTITGQTVTQLTSTFSNGVANLFYEVANTYASPYPVTGVQTDNIFGQTASVTGVQTGPTQILRSVGLASKAFIGPTGTTYMLVAYGVTAAPTSSNQPSYFLIDGSGNIYMRLAYSNGGGYYTTEVLPSVTALNSSFFIPYLYADFLTTVNKTTNSALPANAIYTQLGVNLATFEINDTNQYSSEIADTLHLTGGQLWMYDGANTVEHGFQVWPEDVQAVWSATGGNMAAIPVSGGQNTNAYFYQFCYEWTDNQGNLHRSAPSIPIGVTTTGSGTTGSVTLYVPTLRLTYKTSVRIVGYRWSVGDPVYYEFTSVLNPVLNAAGSTATWATTSTSTTGVDFATILDTQSDAQILGNTPIYTAGGVVEDIAAPASIASTLFNNRLFLIDAEDQNLLWFSKQVIEAVPVEMSDLLTIYVAPTTGTQGSTGPCTALAPMDDKLIIFKSDAAYYINGTGPDNTGANSSFSDAIFITSSVGCNNPNSIVLMQKGLMFQSDGKGIWLIGRDLSTSYIGAPVEKFNNLTVLSAQSIPGTNQVRFVMSNNTTLIYDYYFNQWGTFTNINAISSTLFNRLDTYLNTAGQIFQETAGSYVDGSSPVLLSFTSAWISVAGLQGYERFYFMYLLGTYSSPFKLNIQLAYDYNPSPSQNILVSPENYTPAWGSDNNWGANKGWGGPGNSFQVRIFPSQQKCETFQVTLTEVYDGSLGQSPGQGLSLSGMNLVVGVKKGYRTQKASNSFG